MSWIGSIMGEYLASKAGLGYLIVYGGQVFKLDLVMAATVTLCALAGAMYFAVALLERLLRAKR
jgi:NitT/TauT family transport system permease protein